MSKNEKPLPGGKLRWTPEEDKFIDDNIIRMTVPEIAKALGRTKEATRKRTYTVLGPNPTHRKWTEEEVAFLRANSETMTKAEICKALGRSNASVRKKMLALFGHEGRRHDRWTNKEVQQLLVLAETTSTTKVAKKLGRTRAAVLLKLSKLGISIKQGKRTTQDVADILGVHQKTVLKHRDRLGLKFRTKHNTRGPYDWEIAALAKGLLNHPNPKGRDISAKRLRDVIKEYGEPNEP